MSTTIIILVTALICSLWSSIWLIIWASTGEPEWMTYIAGGPILLVWLCVITVLRSLYSFYFHFNYKAVIVDEDGNKYWCESNKLDDICEKYNVEAAFEFAKSTAYKPYKPKTYNMDKNPRYIHRSVACKFPKLYCIKEVKTK